MTAPKNNGGKVPTGDVANLGPPATTMPLPAPPVDWRDRLSWGYGRQVREIQGRWSWARTYSDKEAARDVDILIGILSVVQTELETTTERLAEILPYAVCGCQDDSLEVCVVCETRDAE